MLGDCTMSKTVNRKRCPRQHTLISMSFTSVELLLKLFWQGVKAVGSIHFLFLRFRARWCEYEECWTCTIQCFVQNCNKICKKWLYNQKKIAITHLEWIQMSRQQYKRIYIITSQLSTCLNLNFTFQILKSQKNKIKAYKGPIGLVGREFTNFSGDQSSVLGRIIQKIQKMVLDASLLNSQHYK